MLKMFSMFLLESTLMILTTSRHFSNIMDDVRSLLIVLQALRLGHGSPVIYILQVIG